ncbi:carboxypeptidase regulatory-like domain-containing protein [Geomonas azotofigens]|uniref:carboxypeptidase regulatory-like domain-containing protein n=1 Tax=Geomonas azotofigens TaxID=2843196 RepID=UPI001C11F742|nr:carboxypeptidase regulatory-like domain-containing protein [Geomonas azotofigens]MBU5613524.1 carboxypeptidase regulatory-like domain-containing protein [Geomonas azotofigens]
MARMWPVSVSIASPQDGAVVNTSSITVSGSVNNNAQVTVNGVQASVVNGSYSVSIALIEGANTITVQAKDQDDQVASQSINVTCIISGNIIGTVTNSLSGSALPSATVSVTDSANGLHTAVSTGDGKFTITGIPLGSFRGNVTKDGYATYTFSGTITPGGTVTINAGMAPILPIISAATANSSTVDSAIISWTTDQPAGSLVEYGATVGYGNTATDGALVTNHVVTISGLVSATAYHFRVSSTNQNGFTSTSGDLTFTTPQFTAKTLGDFGNVTVMEVTGNYDINKGDGTLNVLPRQEIAKEYFRTHADAVDFLVILSNFDYAMPDSEAKGFYLGVKNDTQGIGQALFDNSPSFGSAGKLYGTIDLGNVTALAANPYGPKLDETIITLNHELMHRFGAYVRFKNPDGSLNDALLGRDAAHWSYLLDTQGSVMYGNGWRDNGDGTYTSTAMQNGFSPLDLYLMGMIPKEQVSPMLLIENPSIDKNQIPQLGAKVTGTAKTVTVDDIIAAEGTRIPDASVSRKSFKVGFVLLMTPGGTTTTATAAIETLRTAWAGKLAELTRRGGSIEGVVPSLTVQIEAPLENATVTGRDCAVSGTVINSTGAETGIMVNGIPATISGSRFIANHVPLVEGTNSIQIKATDANGLTTTQSRSVTAQIGNYLRVISNIESGTAPLDISIRLDGNFVIANPTVGVAGPVPVLLTPRSGPAEFTANFTVEGTYTITASALGPDGQMYTSSGSITVMSRSQLEVLLQGKWEGMKSKLMAKDVEGAVAHLLTSAQNAYRTGFTAYVDKLPLLAQDLPSIELVYASEQRAKARLFREETVKGQKVVIGYPVYYIQEDGTWKLVNF